MGSLRRRDDRGAAAVEFGLIAPLLVVLLLGIVQFSLWFWSWQVGGHAAREAARVAAVSPCDDGAISTAGMDALAGAPSTSAESVVVSNRSASPLKVGDQITVSVSFDTVDFGFFPGLDGQIDKEATSRVENVPVGSGC